VISAGNAALSVNLLRPLSGLDLKIFATTSTDGMLEVSIYNLIGEKIFKLFDGQVSQGQKIILSWDGRNGAGELVASGTYYAVLEGAGLKQVKKFKVIK
jgi:hypothetical protein